MAQNNDDNDIKWLYGKLKAKGYDIGSEADFRSSLANDADRKWYYDKAKGMGLDMGSMADFESMYKPKQAPASKPQQQKPQATTKPQATAPAPAKAQPQKNKPLSAADRQKMLDDVGNMVAQTNASLKRAYNRMDFAMANTGLNVPRVTLGDKNSGVRLGQNRKVVAKMPKFNAQSGKIEQTYITESGNEYSSRAEADFEQNAIDEEARKPLGIEMNDQQIDTAQKPASAVTEALWKEAEAKLAADRKKNAEDVYGGNPWLNGGREMHMVNAGLNSHKNEVSRLTRFDLQKMMDNAWGRVGKQMTASCYEKLRKQYPTAPERQLQMSAENMARRLSDNAVYKYAVAKNTPKSTLEFFAKTAADMNLLRSISKGLARSEAGTTGDLAAYEQAMSDYGKDHRVAQIGGTVVGMMFDPTTIISGGIGSGLGKGALYLGGRMIAKRAAGGVGARMLGSTLGGRVVAGVAGGAGNLGTYEGIKEGESQWVHGGHINPKTGKNEGYSVGDVLASTGRGTMLGAITGTMSPLLGNVADKLVKATSNTAGKVGIRAGELATSTVAEGTIFSIPEWISGDGDAMDVWTDNMAMMLGFKAKHMVKSAPRVIAGLRPVENPKTMQERNHNRMSFMERLRKQMDASPRDLAFTYEEREELRRNGYGELADLFKRTPKQQKQQAKPTTTDGKEMHFDIPEADVEDLGKEWLKQHPEFDGYEAMERLMQDPSVSQSARAKAYYILTGRQLPMGTVTGYTTEQDENGNIYVKSVTANGEVVTSKRFADEATAKTEQDKIMHQTELNSVDVGERYSEAKADDKIWKAAVEAVAPGADPEVVMRNYKAAKEGDKDAIANYGQMVDAIDEFVEANKGMADAERPEAIRTAINEELGVDIDKALRKEPSKRTDADDAAVKEYLERLFPDQNGEAEQPMSDAEAGASAIYDQSRLLWGKVEEGYADAKADIDAIVLRMKEALQECEDAFGTDAEMRMAEMQNNPWALVNDPELTEYQQDAVLYYINAKAAMDGVRDASNDAMENKRNEVQANVQRHTHQDLGVVQPATMKVGDKQVYIVKGNVALFPDGSGVDVRNSDQSIVVCDAETGEYKFVSPDQLLNVGEAIDPQTELDEAFANIQAEHDAVLGDMGNGENVQNEGGNAPYSVSDDVLNNVPEPNREQMRRYAAATADFLNGKLDERGYLEAVDLDKGWIAELTAEEIAQQARMEANAFSIYLKRGVTPEAEVNAKASEAHQAEESKPQPQGSALDRIPTDDKTGEPMFERVDKETALDALNEVTGGNEATTTAIVNAQVEQAQKTLDALKKKQPTKKLPTLKGSPMAMLKAQQEADAKYTADMEQYNAQVAAAEEKLGAWSRIYSLMNERNRAVREQREAEQRERDQQAHDAAVAQVEEQKRIAAEKAKEQAEVGTHAVNPKIKAKWDGAAKVEGNANAITLADGSTIRGHYVLTEAGAASASHDVGNAFEPTEGFPIDENGESVNDRDYKRDTDAQRIVRDIADNYDNRALQSPVIVSKDGIVLSGNNRTMSGDIAARQGTDKAYIDHLREFGEMYGFTPEQIDGMKHPRVVFVPDEAMPYDATTFARFNAEQQKKQGKDAQAVKLGKVVPDNVFTSITNDISRYDRLSDYYADDKAVSSAISQLLGAGVINEMQLPELRTGNTLSAAGRELIENTLIGKVFQTSPDAVRQIIGTPTLRHAVMMGLNEIAHNRTLAKSGYDLSGELGAAVDLVARAKASNASLFKEGMPVSPFGRQQGLFDDEYGDSRVTDATVLILADILNSGKPSDLRKFLSVYNNDAAAPASGQMDMFGGGVRSKEELLNDINEYFRNATPREQQAIVDAAIAERKQRAEATAQTADGAEGGEGSETDKQRGNLRQSSGVDERTRRNGIRLTEKDADTLISRMEYGAETSTEKTLTAESWAETFDENNSTDTPIGRVKMGEHQITKFFDKKRVNEFGMVGPTLKNPDAIIEEASQAKDGVAERDSSFVFVKAFNRGMKSAKFYASITVKIDGMEISISSHYMNKNALKKKMQEGKVIHIRKALSPNSSEWHLAEHQDGVPDLLPTQRDNAFFADKGNQTYSKGQENDEKSRETSGIDWSTYDKAPKNEAEWIDMMRFEYEGRPVPEAKDMRAMKRFVDEVLSGDKGVDETINERSATTSRSAEIDASGLYQSEKGWFSPKKYGDFVAFYDEGEKAVYKLSARFDGRGRLRGVTLTKETFANAPAKEEAAAPNNKPRLQEAGGEAEGFAERHGVETSDVEAYENAMEIGNVQAAHWALGNIRRTMRIKNKALKLSEFKDVFAEVRNELYERFGNLDELQREYEEKVLAERNVMEAARKKAEEEAAERRKHLDELSLLSDEEIDKRYMDAIDKGDETAAREMLDEAARRKGYADAESDYQGEGAWSAPSNPGYESDEARRADVEDNAPDVNLEYMALGYTLQPDDYFTHPERYAQDTPHGKESTKAIQDALDALKRGEKDVKVKVYRAVPLSVKEGKLRNGDWVTPSRKYADMHGNSRLEGKYRVIEDEVPAKDLWWDGNDANEFGYDNGKHYRYKNAKNNRKLNDLVTRDDKGNVIPPSKRFNSRKADERYHRGGKAAPVSHNERVLRDALDEHLSKNGMEVIGTEEGQRVLDMANGEDVRLEAKHRSERAEKRNRVLSTVDEAVSIVTGKPVKDVRAERKEREAEYRMETKELYDAVLSGDFNDVTLQRINDYLDHVTPLNEYGRPLSKRLPQEVLRRLRKGERTSEVDVLFSRISESSVPAHERTRAEGKRRIEEKKKELLKGWAIATGNWHTSVADFTSDTEPIGSGKDSVVYQSDDGRSVIKVSAGKDNLRKFRPDIDAVTLFNHIFRYNPYKILGYGEVGGKFVKFLEQPIVDFSDSTPLSAEERVRYMEGMGFAPMNEECTAFSNGKFVVADLQGNNIVKDKSGNVRVIDADVKLHTKDMGGKWTYPDVETDTGAADRARFFRTANGEAYGFTVGGRIYYDPRIATSETLVHEYAHLWASALRGGNAEEWKNVVGLMKGTSVWDEVKRLYPELKTDDEIADEVIAQYSGRRGAERLREEARKIAEGNGGVFEKAEAISALEKIRRALSKFWKGVCDMLHIHYTSAEEVADRVMKDLLDGVDPRKFGRDNALRMQENEEIADIVAKAKAGGTYMKAPNGKPSKLSRRQWAQVRTKAFKTWFGDWEKAARIEKLRESEPVEITGEEIEITDDFRQNKKNALAYGKGLQGAYTNADTGNTIQLQRGRKNGGLNEVLQHNYKDVEHIQSIAAIPQIIEKSVYIDSEENKDVGKNPKVSEYQHYVCGLKIGNEDYTVLSTIAVDKDGNRYYDHNLTRIEKGKLLDQINGQAVTGESFGTTPGTNPTTLNGYKGKKLVSILQTNSSKVVDENGEPRVLYHQTNSKTLVNRKTGERFDDLDWNDKSYWQTQASQEEFEDTWEGRDFYAFDNAEHGRRSIEIPAFFFSPQYDEYHEYGERTIAAFLNVKNPAINPKIENAGVYDDAGEKATGKLIEEGHDGFIREYDGVVEEINAFYPNQIKSATDNVGTFDAENDDIRFQFVGERGADGKVADEDKTKFRLLEDDDPKAQELEALPDSELVPVYRNVQAFEDDALGSPMAFTDADTGERRELQGQKWNYSNPPKVKLTEEQQRQLDELNKNGYIMVDGKKKTELPISEGLKFVKPKTKEAQLQYFLKKNPEDSGLWAAYDPYDHAIETPLNTQFGEAYKRPNLVVVRSLIPKSEIDEPFKADYALLPTGAHQWNNGRTLYLSRWSKIDKVLTREEEAKLIDEYWKKNPGKREALKSHRDYNRFVPQVRRELEKMGYRFELDGKELTPEESLALDKQNWENRDVIPGREGNVPFVSNEDIKRINAKMAGKWVGEPKEAMENAMTDRVNELADRLHTPVRIIRTDEEIAALPSARQRRMKGSFNPMTGEVTIVVPNNANMADVENTFIHEVVGHDGLRVLFPEEEKLNNALDELYRVSKDEIRNTIDRMAQKMYDAEVDRLREKKRKEHEAKGEDSNATYYADMAEAHAEANKKREQFKRDATEEYGADLAGRIGEKGFEKMSAEELTFWGKLKSMLQKALQKLLEGLKIPDKRKWSDKDWAFVLHEAYKRKKNGGRPTVFDAADTEVMRRKTGYGETKFNDGIVAKHSEKSIDEINNTFNEELQQQIDGKLPTGHIYKMGKPGKVLLSTGVPNLPIQMNAKRLQDKATMFDHDFNLSEVRDLVKALQHPLAVFAYGDKSKAQNIIVPLQKDGKNFIVGLSLNPTVGGRKLEINSIRNVFPKDNSEWLNWINQGKALYIDKEKIQTLIDQQRTNLADVEYLDLDSVAKVIKDFANPKVADEKVADDDIMFRDGDSVDYEKALARDVYERRVSRGMYQMQEALQDSMRGLKEAMDAILKAEDGTYTGMIEDVAGYENAYLGENRLSSVNQAETAAFARTLFKPMLEEVAKLAKTADEHAELTDYMMAKHGLERNDVMARRAAAKQANKEFGAELRAAERKAAKDPADQDAQDALDDVRQRRDDREQELYFENQGSDYAGLTTLTGTDNVADAEAEARRMVWDYEHMHDIDHINGLWDSVDAVNKATLLKTYESGLISRDVYNDIKGMYKNYIPLRGFDDKTSGEAYAYLSDKRSAFNSPIKTAKGRKSKADDPLANMEAMAESAIMQGNRNMLVKQRFLNFALNHPSDLVTVSDLWLWHNDAADEWQPVKSGDIAGTEAIEEDDSAAEVERKTREFEEAMRQAAKSDPAHYKRQKDAPEIPYRVVESRDLHQHQVLVKRNGRDIILTINGNPRAAQALNGQTNPDKDISGVLGSQLVNGLGYINRKMSAWYTTRNPDFVVSNFVRDLLYSNTMAWVKESPNYAVRYHKNFVKLNPARMKMLLAKLRKGTLDMNNETEKMFYQFIMNGGETGYANIRDIEQRKNDIRRELKTLNGKMPLRKGWKLLGERLDEYNRAVESCARFAAFMTSRQMKRSIDRSIYDAKEISVNFNKKGSGAKFMGAEGQTKLGNAAAFTSGLGRSFYVFWNAAIQGTTNFGRQAKRHPAKAMAGAASMFLLGALMAAIGGDDGDDGEKNAYYNLPDYVRRSNIVFRLPGMDKSWISLPLPVEYRAMYGMGELAVSAMSGKCHYTGAELAHEIAGQVSQMLPIDVLEGGGGWKAFVPSAVKPLAEVWTNESWTGMPIYKKHEYNENMPEWTKAYKSANGYLVGLSEALNEATGGDAYTKGKIDINPAKVEYLLNGYFGGLSRSVDELTKMGETVFGDREYDPKSFMLLNRLVKRGDERTEYRAVNNEYFRIKEASEDLRRRLNHYEDDTMDGVFDYAEKIAWLNSSPEYRILDKYEEYSGDINAINEELKDKTLRDEEREWLEAELNGKKKELVDAVNAIRDGK